MEKFLMTNSNHKSEMLADIVNAFSEYADRPALIIDDTTYSYAEPVRKGCQHPAPAGRHS